MSFEYLIVGIAKDEQHDYREFYDKTKVETYMFALSMVKDRVLARDIAVEAYKRVKSLAYKFDTDLNAEYWLLDIVKNLSINSLKHEELKKVAESNRVDNLSGILSELILETAEDRSKFIVLRTVSGLNKSEIARLLWYHGGSASAEYRRGINELISMAPDERNKDSVISDLQEDMKNCTPDMWGLVIKDEDTRVSFVSHEELEIDDDEIAFSEDKEELKKIKRAADKKKRKVKIFTVVIAVLLLCCLIAGITVAIVAYNKKKDRDTKKEEKKESIEVIMPQFRTKIAMAELDGVLYYANYNDGGKLYKASFTAGNVASEKVSDDVPRDMVSYDAESKYIIYRNNDDGKIYRYSPSDGQTVKLCEKSGAALCLDNDVLYFSTSTGISSISVTGDESSYREVFVVNSASAPFRYDIEKDDKGNVYFSGGADAGLYVLDEFINENTGAQEMYNEGIYAGNIYDMHIYNDNIYFDISENGTSVLCKIDIANEYKVSRIENVYLSSAAIYVSDGYIYYAGYKEDPSVNESAERGLFKMSIDTSISEMIAEQSDATLFISDLYISDDKIYCYSCTADASGIKKLTAYNKNGLNKDNYSENAFDVF